MASLDKLCGQVPLPSLFHRKKYFCYCFFVVLTPIACSLKIFSNFHFGNFIHLRCHDFIHLRLLKSDWLSSKVNRNMLQISVFRLRRRIEGAILVTFVSLIRFTNQLVNKNACFVFFRCVPRHAHAIARLSVLSLLW